MGKSGVLYDITSSKGDIETSGGRFSELDFAWKYISESPFTGVMPWGGMGLGGTHNFVHSGLLHLWLKGGIFAFLFFCLILWGYFLFTRKVKREIAPQAEVYRKRLLLVCCLAYQPFSSAPHSLNSDQPC